MVSEFVATGVRLPYGTRIAGVTRGTIVISLQPFLTRMLRVALLGNPLAGSAAPSGRSAGLFRRERDGGLDAAGRPRAGGCARVPGPERRCIQSATAASAGGRAASPRQPVRGSRHGGIAG